MGSGCCKAKPTIDSEFDNLILNVSYNYVYHIFLTRIEQESA